MLDEEIESDKNGPSVSQDVQKISGDGFSNRPFDLFMFAGSIPKPTQTLDDVSKYNMVSLDCVTKIQKEFIYDDFLDFAICLP